MQDVVFRLQTAASNGKTLVFDFGDSIYCPPVARISELLLRVSVPKWVQDTKVTIADLNRTRLIAYPAGGGGNGSTASLSIGSRSTAATVPAEATWRLT